jgi:hypothetical protein
MAFSMAAEIERDLVSKRTKEALIVLMLIYSIGFQKIG